MRRTRKLALSWIAVTAAAIAPWTPASAEVPKAAWYWSLAPAPAPPYAGDGTLLVEGRPTGPTAVAVVHAAVPASAVGVSLTLRLHEESIAVEGAVVLACRATGSWRDGGAQPWAGRPSADCTAGVPGVLSADQATMTFAITSLVGSGSVDVLLAPGESSDRVAGVNGSTFSAVFDRPDERALAVTTPAPATSPDASAPASSSLETSVGPVELPVGAPPAATAVPTAPAAPAPSPASRASEIAAAVPASAGRAADGAGRLVLSLVLPITLLAWRSRDVVAVLAKVRRSS